MSHLNSEEVILELFLQKMREINSIVGEHGYTAACIIAPLEKAFTHKDCFLSITTVELLRPMLGVLIFRYLGKIIKELQNGTRLYEVQKDIDLLRELFEQLKQDIEKASTELELTVLERRDYESR